MRKNVISFVIATIAVVGVLATAHAQYNNYVPPRGGGSLPTAPGFGYTLVSNNAGTYVSTTSIQEFNTSMTIQPGGNSSNSFSIANASNMLNLELNSPIEANQGGLIQYNGANNNFVIQQTENAPFQIENSGGNGYTLLGNSNNGVNSSTPGSIFSIGTNNGINFTSATTSFSSTGGINLNAGCFAVKGACVTGGGTISTVGGAVTVIHQDGTQSYYSATTSSVLGNGTLLKSVVNGIATGYDNVVMSCNTFDIGDNTGNEIELDLTNNGAKNLSLHGCGMYSTIIEGSGSGSQAIVFASSSDLGDFSIIDDDLNSKSHATFWYPILGPLNNLQGLTNVHIHDIYCVGGSDCILAKWQFATATSTVYIDNFHCLSAWDCLIIDFGVNNPNGFAYVRNSTFISSTTDNQKIVGLTHGIDSVDGHTVIDNDYVSATASSTIIAYGIAQEANFGNVGSIDITGGTHVLAKGSPLSRNLYNVDNNTWNLGSNPATMKVAPSVDYNDVENADPSNIDFFQSVTPYTTGNLQSSGIGTFNHQVGIGTTSPYAKLDIVLAPYDNLTYHDPSSGSIFPAYSFMISSSTLTSTTTQLVVNAAGYFGLSTTTPWRTLSVVGNSDLGTNALAGYFTATSSTASSFLYASTTALSATTLCLVGDICRTTWPSGGGGTSSKWATSTNGVSIYPNGGTNIGVTIGEKATTTNSIFEVTGTSTATVIYATSTLSVGSSTPFATVAINPTAGVSSNEFVIGSSTATALLVSNSGNVGVATTSPYNKLSVNGNTTISKGTNDSTDLLTLRGYSAGGNIGSYQYLKATSASTGRNVFIIGDDSGGNYGTFGPAGSQGSVNGIIGESDYYNNAVTSGDKRIALMQVLSDTGGSGNNQGGQFTFFTNNGTSLNAPFEIRSGGNVGVKAAGFGYGQTMASDFNVFGGESIGATYSASNAAPSNGLLVQGNAGFGTTSPFATLAINPVAGAASNQFVVGSSSATAFIINNNGNVGVATTTPFRTFSVQGTVAMNGLTAFATGDSAVCLRGGGEVTFDSGVSSCIISSRTVKHDITDDSYKAALARVSKLDPVTFEYNGTNKPDIGLIAEDVAKIDPRYAQYSDKTGKPAAINWSAITADLILVVQHEKGTANTSNGDSWLVFLNVILLMGIVGLSIKNIKK